MFDLAEVTLEEQEFGPEKTKAADLEDGQDMQEDTGSGIIRIKDEDDVHLMTKGDTCLVYKKCLLKLASTKVDYTCKVKGCSGPVSFRTENIGSALYIYWVSFECFIKNNSFRFIIMHCTINMLMFYISFQRNVPKNMKHTDGVFNQF